MKTAYRKYNGRGLLHVISLTDPPPSSFAASILLQEQYKNEDDAWEENRMIRELCKAGRMNYTTVRRVFLKRLVREGKLFCRMCGRTDLIYNERKRRKLPQMFQPPNLATVDHIIPLSEGGLKYSTQNMMCLCNACNNRKGSFSVLKIGHRYVLNG